MINMAIGMSEYMFRTQKGAEFILSNIYSSRDILLLLKLPSLVYFQNILLSFQIKIFK